MIRRRAIQLGLAGVLATTASVGGLRACDTPPESPPPDCPAAVVAVTPPTSPGQWRPASTTPVTFDATGTTFTSGPGQYVRVLNGAYTPRPPPTPIGCWLGGEVSDSRDPQTTSWEEWHDTGTAFVVKAPGFAVVGVRIVNSGDGINIDFGGEDWRVEDVRVGTLEEPAHDDCLENDDGYSGRVVDSVFAGCFVFMSSRSSTMDGTGSLVDVRRVAVRLAPYQNSYRVADFGPNRHGGFFKWAHLSTHGKPPALAVSDSTFRADSLGSVGGTVYDRDGDGIYEQGENVILGLPPGTECGSGVVLLGAAWALDVNSRRSWETQCPPDLRVVTDPAQVEVEWDAAVAARGG